MTRTRELAAAMDARIARLPPMVQPVTLDIKEIPSFIETRPGRWAEWLINEVLKELST